MVKKTESDMDYQDWVDQVNARLEIQDYALKKLAIKGGMDSYNFLKDEITFLSTEHSDKGIKSAAIAFLKKLNQP